MMMMMIIIIITLYVTGGWVAFLHVFWLYSEALDSHLTPDIGYPDRESLRYFVIQANARIISYTLPLSPPSTSFANCYSLLITVLDAVELLNAPSK
jgi:hypothetical protein